MGWISFNGISTEGMPGVSVNTMPSHRKAGKRFTEYYVKGRDGALHVFEGYSNFQLTAVLVLINCNAEMRQVINAWADGTGKLVTSDDPELAYIASVSEEVRWTRQDGNNGFYDTAEITFDCYPFMVEAIETVIDLEQPTSGQSWTYDVHNPGTAEALPIIQITGIGEVTITAGSKTITLNFGLQANVTATLDCENGYAYSSNGAVSMSGEFPSFPVGDSTMTFSSNCYVAKITPKWRWL